MLPTLGEKMKAVLLFPPLTDIKYFLEIIILWFAIYKMIAFTQGSRAYQALRGLIVLVFIFFAVQILGFNTLSWILTRIFAFSILAFLIVFQPELRRILVGLGQSRFFVNTLVEEYLISEIADCTVELSKKKIGAIVAIERQTGLKPYVESGVEIDAKVTSDLLKTIFMPNTPLHDGAVVVEQDRVKAAACLFPLSQNPKISKTMGTRHRAAIGLTEESDAVCVVVSEQTGSVSIAVEGKLIRDLDKETLIKTLKGLFQSKRHKKHIFDFMLGVKK